MQKLNAEQIKASQYTGKSLMIVAGAGTGKTTVIAQRIMHFILKSKVSPSNILALTFTEKAANEMETRVDQSLPLGYTQMQISTFHGFCEKVYRESAHEIGLSQSARLLDQSETVDFLKKNLFSLELDYFLPLGNPSKFLYGLISHFSRISDEDISPQNYVSWANKKRWGDSPEDKMEEKKWKELSSAFEKYEKIKIKNNVLDFSDLISKTLKIFRDRPNVLRDYQNRYTHIMVDEFQDTNFAQYELLKLLVKGDKSSLTVVCDDNQSIYRFRGAAVSNILSFKKDYPESKTIVLDKNYRSFQEILDKSYSLISNNNPDTLESKLGISKKLISLRKESPVGVVKHFQFRTGEEEAQFVANEILRLIGEKKYKFSDFAILSRANSHALPFVEELKRSLVPLKFLGPTKLFSEEIILDLTASLRVLEDPLDSQSLFRVLSMPQFGINSIELTKLLSLAKKNNRSLYEILETDYASHLTHEKTQDNLKIALDNLNNLIHQKKQFSAGKLLYMFFEDSGLLSFLGKNMEVHQDELEKITKLFGKIKAYENLNTAASLGDVLNWIDVQKDIGESGEIGDLDIPDGDSVNVSTIHSSKGLEFPVVFLVSMVEGRFPGYDRSEQIPIPDDLVKEALPSGDFHLQEERRLCYVGMTRAKNLLYMLSSVKYGGAKREKKRSVFLDEVFGNEKPVLSPNITLTSFSGKENNTPKKRFVVNSLSYSSIETFKICPLHYKLNYIVGLPRPMSPAQSFGNSIHRALKKISEERAVSLKKASNILEEVWISEGYESRTHEEKMLAKGKNFIEFFMNNWIGGKSALLELPFNFKLNNLKISGVMDRVDVTHGDKINIIDYKTGSPISQKEADSSLQMSIYALAAQKIKDPPFNKNSKDIELSLYFFETGEIVKTKRSQNDLLRAQEEILAWRKKITESDFECSQSFLCKNCEYKDFCKSA